MEASLIENVPVLFEELSGLVFLELLSSKEEILSTAELVFIRNAGGVGTGRVTDWLFSMRTTADIVGLFFMFS